MIYEKCRGDELSLQNQLVKGSGISGNFTFFWHIVLSSLEKGTLSEIFELLTVIEAVAEEGRVANCYRSAVVGSSDNNIKTTASFSDPIGNKVIRIRHGGRGAALRAGVKLVKQICSISTA